MKESKFVKTKIFAGYAILIAVCVLSVGYVYRTVVRFSTPDGSYSLLHTKRSVAGQTLYHLYQAESYGQLMIAGYQSYESRYKRELRTVRGLIDSLRGLTAAEDSLQTMRLDSIVRLLADKERRTMSLRRTIRSAATSTLLDKNIRELIGPADSAARGDSVVVRAADTVASRVVVQDTVTVPRRKRKFFRRFADLFSPPKEEAGMIISRHERVVDSLPAPEVKDTIAVVLRTLQDRVTSDRIGIYDRAWNEGMRLRYSNELVNTKIYRLIMDFEAEDTAFLMNRFEQTEAIRRRSSLTLGVIAVAAVVLLLLFVGMIMDTTSAILILTPLLLPVAQGLGINPYHFGVIMVVNLAIGFVTPPVGVNLYVASGISGMSVMDIAKKAKALGLDAIHDTVHEMAKDEARHGKAFNGLLNRYFK